MSDRPRIGKHALETLTMGMYSNPLDILREYVQNACDAIKEAIAEGVLASADAHISIVLDPEARTITIRDNGIGMRPDDARKALRDVGRSEKHGTESIGFRGIGRLGGLAYCTELTFRTKRHDESRFYLQTWDCRELQKLLRPDDHRDLDVADVIEAVCSDSSGEYPGARDGHFFEVRMIGVRDQRLLDLEKVRTYLSQALPLPFDNQSFRFGRNIHQLLRTNVPNYEIFNVLVNDQLLFKPYRDTVPLSSGPGRSKNSQQQRINDYKFIELRGADDTLLAVAWIGETDFLGMISPDSGVAGIRIRCGNMMVGNGTALEEAFPKSDKRFAGYLIGEVHAVDTNLTPNARRDDFEPNPAREALMRAIAAEIADPARRDIREHSNQRSIARKIEMARRARQQAQKAVTQGIEAEARRDDIVEMLENAGKQLNTSHPRHRQATEALQQTIEQVKTTARHIVDQKLSSRYGRDIREVIKTICEMIYDDYEDPDKARRLIQRIVRRLASGGRRRKRA